MATADEAIKMLTEILLLNREPQSTLAVHMSPAASLRQQAEEIERKEAVIQRAWQMVRSHR